MTPREILAKYGLASDVKSVKERMEGNLGLYLGIVDHKCPMYSHNIREQEADKLYNADLDLLCEMAEKVESTQATNKDLKNTISAIYQVSRKWFDDVHADGNDSMEEIKKILEGKE